jgi:hypothetical protein
VSSSPQASTLAAIHCNMVKGTSTKGREMCWRQQHVCTCSTLQARPGERHHHWAGQDTGLNNGICALHRCQTEERAQCVHKVGKASLLTPACAFGQYPVGCVIEELALLMLTPSINAVVTALCYYLDAGYRPQEGLFGLREWLDEGFYPEGWVGPLDGLGPSRRTAPFRKYHARVGPGPVSYQEKQAGYSVGCATADCCCMLCLSHHVL